MKKAIVTDFLIQQGGAEQVTRELANLFPKADIFTLLAAPDILDKYFSGRNVIQHPKLKDSYIRRKYYRKILPFYPTYIEDFDLSSYDLIISSSYLFAKGVLCNPDSLHISYVHTPMRQAWTKYHEYLHNENDIGRFSRLFLRYVMNYLRLWDVSSSNRVDYFIANSSTVQRRIKNIYRRDAALIHPPVKVEELGNIRQINKSDYYVTVGRLVPYKKVELLIKTFNQLPDKKLYIVGDGNNRRQLEKMAESSNITFTGYIDEASKIELMSKAKAFLFAAEEDFGMSPVEALALGTPVIAYNKGGARDYIQENINGHFFDQQNEDCLRKALMKFEQSTFDPKTIHRSVKSFDETFFRHNIKSFIEQKVEETIDES